MTNNMEALTLLIHAKADLNVQNMPGQTALAIAALQNHIDCVKILLDAGAKITQMTLKLATNQGIKSLLDDVSKKRAQKMINAIHNEEISEAEALKLLDGGANINYKDEYGKTVLMEAAFAGYVNLVTSLLGMLEIDADQQDNDGNTALILAARGKHPAVVAKLLTDDINVDQQENKKGVNALMWAVVNNDVPTAKKLLQAGADVTIKNKKGATAMSLAKSDEMRKLLNKYLPK
jgi:ankyrin repeat protein